MLLQYSVSNYKSIGHPVVFSMFPSKMVSDERFLKKINTKKGTLNVLSRAGFFGPNASGKSSFIESIEFARDFIVNGQKSGKAILINQFRGKIEELEGLSTFQFVVYIDEEIYEYGFAIDRSQVYEEWLMVLEDNQSVPLFTRITNEDGFTDIDIESHFAERYPLEYDIANVLKGRIQSNQKNQLFLYKLYDNGISVAETVVNWFNNLQFIFPTTNFISLPFLMKENIDFKEYISEKLKALDTGVYDVIDASREMDFDDLVQYMDISQTIIDDIENSGSGFFTINGKHFIIKENIKDRPTLVQIKFQHKLNGEIVNFDTEDESDGTQRLLDLLPISFVTKINKNFVFVVDEIGRSLHTKLTQSLLNEFVSNNMNGNCQILFTSHDVNLINLDYFRQDELWFIEKNNYGESCLRSLSDFELKNGQDVLKSYLNGRFGAIPVIRRDKK